MHNIMSITSDQKRSNSRLMIFERNSFWASPLCSFYPGQLYGMSRSFHASSENRACLSFLSFTKYVCGLAQSLLTHESLIETCNEEL